MCLERFVDLDAGTVPLVVTTARSFRSFVGGYILSIVVIHNQRQVDVMVFGLASHAQSSRLYIGEDDAH